MRTRKMCREKQCECKCGEHKCGECKWKAVAEEMLQWTALARSWLGCRELDIKTKERLLQEDMEGLDLLIRAWRNLGRD